MIKTARSFESWPRTKAGEPLFTCTEDAIFYAHLIINNEMERRKIVRLRLEVMFTLQAMRKKANPNLNRMMKLAVKGQFYRECLEEVERIEKEGK
ncbi:unnamed protein product [marine sediment metagenome]|uniref:Uncharacterized protein n=1 Tax=marine sediment metagenome TaxID=412755 RepID=X1ES12_9ZZZZ